MQRVKKRCNDLATYQGVFVATPAGALLAGSHEDMHDARKVETLLRRGLEKWSALPRAERLLTRKALAPALAELAEVERRSRYPHDGLVLSVVCRDLPREAMGTGSESSRWLSPWLPRRNAYNLDHAWFRQTEARALVPDPPAQGARRDVPRDLVERLARFHLVDLVRGHTAPFPRRAVEQARLTAEVVDVQGALVSLRYRGRTRTAEVYDGVHVEGKWNARGPGIPEPQTRGVDAALEGRAVYDLHARRFVTFELVARAVRWGGNAYNGRLDERDFGPAPLGFVLRLAGAGAAERIPPLFFRSYGWE